MDERSTDTLQSIQGALGAASVLAAAGYTLWSAITERQVAGWLIRMQAWCDDGRYGVVYTWVMTLLTVLGIALGLLGTVVLVRAFLVGRRAPSAVQATARARRLAIGVPALVTVLVAGGLSAFLLIEGRDAAESLGGFVKFALFAIPVALAGWLVLTEVLAPAGWTQGRVTSRSVVSHGDGKPIHTIEVDGTGHTVSALDYERAPEGTLVGILHTGGLFRHVLALYTDLSRIDGPPTAF